jgi:enoyl-CoA hydratase/carnithine racemase
MSNFNYILDEHIAVVRMDSGENRFNFSFFKAFHEILDDIEKTDATALITTSSHEKIWSNGIDLDWLLPAMEKEGPALFDTFRIEMYRFFKRIVTFPMITIAAINGHAFAGGAFLAFSHDFRFMRSERGWISLPEIDLGMPLGPVFTAITTRAVPLYMVEEMQYTARRLTADECVQHHIIKKAYPLDHLMDEVLAFAKAMNKDRNLIHQMKLETLKDVIKAIDNEVERLTQKAG